MGFIPVADGRPHNDDYAPPTGSHPDRTSLAVSHPHEERNDEIDQPTTRLDTPNHHEKENSMKRKLMRVAAIGSSVAACAGALHR